jgi:serine phosphatase RsbU (regulator of sigma subunit)
MPEISSTPATDLTESPLHPAEWSRFDGVDLHARHHAECCGGDFFDGLAVGNHLLFLLTDIAGPRLEARGVAVQVQNAFRQRARELFAGSEVNESDATAALAHAVNLALIEAAQRVRFAPTFLGCFNVPLGILTYCNAGNLLALLRNEDNVQVLEPGGMPLGLFTHSTFEAAILALQEGDTLLMVTKGVIESRRGTTEFGAERVEQLLRKSTASSAAEICDVVLQEAYDYANDSWSRILGLLRARDRRRLQDLTALALVRRHPGIG